MSRKLNRVFVTTHSIGRWRERVDPAGTWPHVEAGLRAATVLERDEPLPFARVDNTRYYRGATNPDLYFVTEPRGFGDEAVVTVIVVEPRVRREPVGPAIRPEVAGQPGPWREPRFRSSSDRLSWLRGFYADTLAKVAALGPVGNTKRDRADRSIWMRRCNKIEVEIRVVGRVVAELAAEQSRLNPEVVPT